jgi:hypothetical protein
MQHERKEQLRADELVHRQPRWCRPRGGSLTTYLANGIEDSACPARRNEGCDVVVPERQTRGALRRDGSDDRHSRPLVVKQPAWAGHVFDFKALREE